ncbi:MAG: serine/threonine protein kinase [Methylococcales bacterium]|nr:serine/threonine protein kinase [Methylococcales bacterium]
MSENSELPEKLGKYKIEKVLGQGAMGIVYVGFDSGIERKAALKTVRKDVLDQGDAEEVLARFKREAQAAGRLLHPNIVSVYEYGEEDDTAYIAMEFVKGKELKDYFDKEERFELKDAVKVVNQILSALSFSHDKGVVHRDIKPANIFVMESGDIKLGDFGIARIDSSNLTQAGTVMGTPSYMSPEQFMGQRVDGRSDLFSVGVILYQFLTNEKPFTGSLTTIMHKVMNTVPENPSALNLQIPQFFDAVVQKAIAKRPDERFQNADEFTRALNAALIGQPMEEPEDEMDDDDATIVGQSVDDATMVATKAPPPPAAKVKPQQTRPAASAQPSHVESVSSSSATSSNKGIAIAVVSLLILVGGGLGLWQMGVFNEKQATAVVVPEKVTVKVAPEVVVKPPETTENVTTTNANDIVSGTIYVTTEPSGVIVQSTGGEFFGTTPAELEFSPGEYELVFEKDGYMSTEAFIEIDPGKNEALHMELSVKE